MIKEIIATGKDVVEAKENARAALGVSELDDVQFEVLHAGSRGIFGIIGVKPAQVKAYIEIKDREPRRQKNDRPKNNKNNQPKAEAPRSEAEEITAADAVAETADAPKTDAPAKKKHKKHKKHTTKPREEKAVETESAPKERSVVIPESELKMELREVAEGEDTSYDFIRTVILDIGLEATAELYSCDDGTRRIVIKGADAHTLIGHHGDTLDALQYLANLASAQKNASGERDKSRVTLDIEGYRAKREETLRSVARSKAARVIRTGRSLMLEPMNAYERRIIHSEIQGIEGVSTNSVGSDNNRRIVIFLTDKKPRGIFEEDKPKATSLTEEFASDEDDVTESIGAIDQSVTAELTPEENETVTVEQTIPDEAESIVSDDDDEGIK